MASVNYVATPTMARFHASNARWRVVFGPVGAGKTVAAGPIEILRRACMQEPDEHGVRDSKYLAARRTFPQLKDTVIGTFFGPMGVPHGLGNFRESPSLDWKAEFALPDGTTVRTSVLFRALPDEASVENLKSLEITGAYLSECAEMPRRVLDVLGGRLRYPYNRSWVGIWGESNPPNVSSHWYKTFEEDRPAEHHVFRQPPPLFYDATLGPFDDPRAYTMNPLAENIVNLKEGYDYYLNQIAGNSWDYINVFILGNYGSLFTGRAVYPEFQEYRHVALNTIPVEPGRLLVCGMDFGRNPSFVPTQMFSSGAVATLAEAVGFDVGLEEFIDTGILPLIRSPRFAGCPVLIIGDPSSDRKESVSQYNAFQMLQARGLSVQRAYSNDPTLRHDSVRHFLTRTGAAYYDPSCTTLIEGFLGAYQYREVKGANTFKALKNDHSHVHDGEQYARLYHYRGSVLDKTTAGGKPTPRKQYLYA